MPVEIRELVIKTNIVTPAGRNEEPVSAEKLSLLKQQVIRECIKALKDRAPKNSFDR